MRIVAKYITLGGTNPAMANLLRSLRIVATFGACLATLVALPIGEVKMQGAFSAWQLFALFLIPAALLGVAILWSSLAKSSFVPPSLTALAGICEGLAVALGFIGLMAAF